MRRSHRRQWAPAAAALVLALAVAGCGKKSAPPPVSSIDAGRSPVASIQDDRLWQYHLDAALTPAERDRRVNDRVREMADLGARVIRVDLRWDQVARAPTRPADPSNPDDPAYNWAPFDAIVDAARASGVEVLFSVWGAPPWAQDTSVGTNPLEQGFPSLRPENPADFGAFGAAAAARFGPRGVRRWEAWNEPNIPLFLYPQFERVNGRWRATSPTTYTALLKAFSESVKRVSPDAVVAGGVMAPVGDKCRLNCTRSTARIAPSEFLRALDAPDLRPQMDVVSHHPYPQVLPEQASVRRPFSTDIYNLDTLVAAIDGTYLRDKPIWLTEYGFSTEPVPNYKKFVTREQQAAYLSDALRRVRAVGPRIQLLTYYVLQDNPSWKSGLADIDGSPKPAYAVYPHPLYAEPSGPVPPGTEVALVGQIRLTRARTTVTIERRDGDGWTVLADANTAADGTYGVSITPSEAITVRGRWSGRSPDGAEVESVSLPVEIAVRAGS
jgi:hypothetical protein